MAKREAWVLVKAIVSDEYPDQGLPGPQPPWPSRPPTGPVDPGYSPPWAQVPPGTGPGGPVDPGYSPPWARPQPPVAGWPVVPGWPGGSLPGGVEGFPHPSHPIYIPVPMPPTEGNPHPEHPIYIPITPPGPVDPGYSPPWAQVPDPNAPHPSHPIMAPGTPGWEDNVKIAFLHKVKAAIDFWTGNLPPKPDTGPEVNPVTAPAPPPA